MVHHMSIVAANYLEPRFEKISKKIRKWHGVLSANLEPENQNDGVLSSHLEPLSTRYLEPPPCFLFCHFVFMRVFQHFFIYMPKNAKRIPPPIAAIPLVNPILRTSLLYQIWASPSG